MSDGPLTYSVPEAARLLGISRAAYYNAIHKNQVPYLRIGRRYVVPRNQLHDLINGQGAA